MLHAYIFSACRTPIGRFRGALSSMAATDLGSHVITAAMHQSRIPAEGVESVILGQVLTAGVGQAPARQAALQAGLPAKAAALTINQVCGSGLQAVMLAAQAVRSHDAEVVVAGGMESMSRTGHVLPRDVPSFGDRTLIDSLQHDGLTCASSGRLMGDIAEGLARQLGLTRGELDQYALESHRRACAAIAAGMFRDEIVPVTVRVKGQDRRIEQDEGPRAETSLESLAALPPVFRPEGVVTAGNASMISDGAAALVIGSEVTAQRYGISPLAKIVASVTVGGPPEDLFLAPVQAILQVTQRAQYSLQDIDLFEINEAFASQVLGCLRGLDLSPDRVNVRGGSDRAGPSARGQRGACAGDAAALVATTEQTAGCGGLVSGWRQCGGDVGGAVLRGIVVFRSAKERPFAERKATLSCVDQNSWQRASSAPSPHWRREC